MDREAFFQTERQAWERFNGLIEQLSEADMLSHQVIESWTVKDILAHIGTWQGRALGNITRLAAGQRVETIEDFDALNAKDDQENKALGLAEARERFVTSHGKLMSFLATLSEEQLFGHKLMRLWVTNSTYRHLEEHAEAIEMWLERRSKA